MSLSKKLILILILVFSCLLVTKASAQAGASFSLSPSSGVCIPGGTFTLEIILTSDEEVDGATAIINYDPDVLEAISLTNGDIFPTELINSIDSSAGRIRLDAGVNFANPDNHSGSGTFGTIKFRVLQVGNATLSFDFTAGDTRDSNVADAETHDDVLTSATGGTYTFQENNTDPSLDPSCATGGDGSLTPTPTPTEPASDGPTPTPTTPPGGEPISTPTTSPTNGGEAPEGGILGPTLFISTLGILMLGAGALLGL